MPRPHLRGGLRCEVRLRRNGLDQAVRFNNADAAPLLVIARGKFEEYVFVSQVRTQASGGAALQKLFLFVAGG